MAKKKTAKSKLKMVLVGDPDSQSAIVGNLKRAFSRSPTVVNFLKKHRREEDWFKKDGSKAKKKHVFYTCVECNKEFNSSQIQVDHKEPVIPLNIPSRHLSVDILIQRLFCDDNNLQILCKQHHKEKSNKENQIRKEWISKVKFIVYRTVNKVNQKSYIGVHKCEDYDDFYLGSGVAFKAAINKYGKDLFYRHILYVYDNANKAFAKEEELVNQEVIDSDDSYNLAIGGGKDTSHITKNTIKVICYQTKEIFNSVASAAKSINISQSSISKVLNNPNCSVRERHFFTVEAYSPNLVVSHQPNDVLSSIVHLNSKTTYASIAEAAQALSLNYKSLRNSLIEKTDDDLYAIDNHFFLYADEFDPCRLYQHTKLVVLCAELNKEFNSLTEAATYIKHKNPAHGAIAIGKSIRLGHKAYKYTWKWIKKTIELI
jgi:hypothetical protein